MDYRFLGDSGIRVSVICLGTMTYGEQNDATEAHCQLDHALARGVNFIDTAEIYPSPVRAETMGKTESIIGDWLAARKNRGEVILASKVSGPGVSHLREGDTRLNRDNIIRAVEGSLRRLKTDYLDLYQMHWPDRNTNFFGRHNYVHATAERMTPLAETLGVFAELIKSGKVRAVGVSNETPWGLSECLRLARETGLPRVVSVQNPYNLLNRTYEIGLAEISAREQCGLLPYSPLAFGALSGKYLGGKQPPGARLTLFGKYYPRYATAKARAAIADYAALSKKYGASCAQMAVAFTVQQPFVTSTIIGATTLPQLEENIAAADLSIGDEWRKEILTLGAKHFNPCP